MTTAFAPNVPSQPAPSPTPRFRDAEQLQRALGGVPLNRILLNPPPGTATVEDVLRMVEREKRGVELVDGTLVEKPVGIFESVIAANVIIIVGNFVKQHKLGFVTGEKGTIKMAMGNVRIPDVAFFRHQDWPGGPRRDDPVPRIAPAIAIEILSAGNTEDEMRIKLKEYFESGVKVVWMIDPPTQTVRICDAPERFRQLTRDDTLDGGDVLPGFSAAVAEIFKI